MSPKWPYKRLNRDKAIRIILSPIKGYRARQEALMALLKAPEEIPRQLRATFAKARAKRWPLEVRTQQKVSHEMDAWQSRR